MTFKFLAIQYAVKSTAKKSFQLELTENQLGEFNIQEKNLRSFHLIGYISRTQWQLLKSLFFFWKSFSSNSKSFFLNWKRNIFRIQFNQSDLFIAASWYHFFMLVLLKLECSAFNPSHKILTAWKRYQLCVCKEGWLLQISLPHAFSSKDEAENLNNISNPVKSQAICFVTNDLETGRQGGPMGYMPEFHPRNLGSTPTRGNSRDFKGSLTVCLKWLKFCKTDFTIAKKIKF